MPETIDSALVTEKNRLHSTSPWIWLVEVVLDSGEAMRVAAFTDDVTYGGDVYSAFPITVAPQRRENDVLPDLEVAVSNLSLEAAGWLQEAKIVGQVCTLRLVHKDHLSQKIHEGRYAIKSATVTLDAATFVVGTHNLQDAPFPAQRFFRQRCRWRYGGAGCLYPTTLPNAISGSNPSFDPSSCDLSLGGPNGCRVHGDNEVANGMPRKHPLRFGGFPSIPKGPSRL